MKTEYKWLLGIATALGLGALLFYKRKPILKAGEQIMEYATNKVWDAISEARIQTLHPLVRDKAREFLAKAEQQGFKLRVTSAFRTANEQEKEYAKGRTAPGSIVTYARAWESSHNYGTAIDVVPIVNGNADWNADWSKIGAIGKSVGFAWGGDWTRFVDRPHFEMNFGHTVAQLRRMVLANKLSPDGYVMVA